MLARASPRPGECAREGRLDCDTNLAVEGFHGLHVDGAEAPSPAAEEEAATALGGERGPGVAARPRGGGAAKAGAGGEGLPQGQRGPGMAARAGGAPVWGTQALPGRADGGGAGPRRLLSAPLGLVRPPSVPVPPTLHPLPPSDSSFTSPPLGPQEPPARGEDGGGSAGSSGCGIQYGGRESGRAARRSAPPVSAPPGDWTVRARVAARDHRANAGQSVATRRSRSTRPRGLRLAPSPCKAARVAGGAPRPALGCHCKALR